MYIEPFQSFSIQFDSIAVGIPTRQGCLFTAELSTGQRYAIRFIECVDAVELMLMCILFDNEQLYLENDVEFVHAWRKTSVLTS